MRFLRNVLALIKALGISALVVIVLTASTLIGTFGVPVLIGILLVAAIYQINKAPDSS